MAPHNYQQEVRILKAKVLLEVCRKRHKELGWMFLEKILKNKNVEYRVRTSERDLAFYNEDNRSGAMAFYTNYKK